MSLTIPGIHECIHECQISTSSAPETSSESKGSLSYFKVASVTSATCSTSSSMALMIPAFLNPFRTISGEECKELELLKNLRRAMLILTPA